MKKLLFLLLLALPADAQNVIPIVNGNVTINPTTPGNSFKILVNQAVTVNIINPPGGFPPTVTILFQQDGTGHAVTYGTSIVNGATVSTTANAYTSTSFQFDGSTNTWYGLSGGGSTGGSFTAAGDLSGSSSSQTVVGIQGAAVPASAGLLGTNSSRQPIAVTSLPAAIGQTVGPNQVGIFASPNCGTQTNCFPVHDDTQVIWGSATYSSGSPNIACAACAFVAGDVGKIFWASNALQSGYTSHITETITCPQTTIMTVTDATHIVLAANCTSNSIANTPIIWGSDDTTDLAAFGTALGTYCTGVLPFSNAQGNDNARMIIQSSVFGIVSKQCANQVSANFSGVVVSGGGIGATTIVIAPNFDYTTCTGPNGLGNACFFGVLAGKAGYDVTSGGIQLRNWEIWGGNSAISTNANGKTGIGLSSNTILDHFACSSWGGGNAATTWTGVTLQNGPTTIIGSQLDGCGYNGFDISAPNFVAQTSMAHTFVGDNYNLSVYCHGGCELSTQGVQLGPIDTNSTNFASVLVTGPTSYWLSTGDLINLPSLGTGMGAVEVNGGATARLSNDVIGNAVSGGGAIVESPNGQAANVYAVNTVLFADSTSDACLNLASSTGNFFDQGGNTTVNCLPVKAGSIGHVFGSASITGTAQTTGNIALTSGWGTSSVGSAGGTSQRLWFTITEAGSPITGAVVTVTFPTAFWQAPSACVFNQTSGTQVLTSVGVAGATTTSVALTFNGTLAAGNTIVGVLDCRL